jgi:hypothetical protein
VNPIVQTLSEESKEQEILFILKFSSTTIASDENI